jgi:POT family proton-dependent oligopeptide transporter
VIYACVIIMPVFIITDPSLTRLEQQRIGVIYIIAFFVIFFWAAYEQAGASLVFFADEQTDRMIGGWEMPAAYFQSFPALFVILLAPVFASLWSFLGRKGIEPASPVKQSLGLVFLALGYLFIAFGVHGIEPGVKVSMIWLTGLYFIHTMGELSLAPIGLSMVYKLSPVRFSSLLMGVWYLSTSAANKLAGLLSSYYPEEGVSKSFLGYHVENLFDFFMVFVFMSGIAAVILFLLSGKLKKMMAGAE